MRTYVEDLLPGIGVALLLALLLAGCGAVRDLASGGDTVSGYPDVDLGVPVVVYSETPERDLHLHVFSPEDGSGGQPAVLFFHGGGFANTRVEQFERQAQLIADAGMIGMVVEYRVTAEGTTRADAVSDGAVALNYVLANADVLGVDPERVAMAGSSAGGALATEASNGAHALVLFNPAVNSASASFVGEIPTIVFHSREDTIVPFSAAEGFCAAAGNCELVAFDEGDHGFFNDDPAFTETNDAMHSFLTDLGW